MEHDDTDDTVEQLMSRLMRAVEASLEASAAVRDALAELTRNGYEARLFFVANAESESADESEDPDAEGAAEGGSGEAASEEPVRLRPEIGAVRDAGDLHYELTRLDREFLKSLHIRPEGT